MDYMDFMGILGILYYGVYTVRSLGYSSDGAAKNASAYTGDARAACSTRREVRDLGMVRFCFGPDQPHRVQLEWHSGNTFQKPYHAWF